MVWSVSRTTAGSIRSPPTTRPSQGARPRPPQSTVTLGGPRPRKNALSSHSGLSLSLSLAGSEKEEGGENICRGRKKWRRLQVPSSLRINQSR